MKTPFYEIHKSLNAKLLDFYGWVMLLQYSTGIINEHMWQTMSPNCRTIKRCTPRCVMTAAGSLMIWSSTRSIEKNFFW